MGAWRRPPGLRRDATYRSSKKRGATGESPLTMPRQFESSNGFEKPEPVLSFSLGQPFGGSNITEGCIATCADRKSTRLNSSHQIISYAVFCLKKKSTTQSFSC